MFALKDSKADKDTLIYLVFHYEGNRFKTSTQLKIHPDLWNKTQHRAKKIKGRSDLSQLNFRLDTIEKAIKEVYWKLTNEEAVINNNVLKNELQINLGIVERKKKPDFFTFADRFADQSKESISPRAKIRFKGAIKLLKEFKKEYGRIDFDVIDVSFYRDFVAFLKRKDLSDNYIGAIINRLKRILNEATELGINKNVAYKSKYFKVITEKVYHIYLTLDELKHLHKFKFKKKYLSDTRDRFLIGCFTGLRFSDFNELKDANFTDDQFITKDMQKVSGRVIIPLHPIVKDIIKKRGIPSPISNQKMNDYLKIMGSEAGLDKEVVQVITKGGVKKHNVYKKHKLITTHTARRSMATNMFISGIDLLTISKLLGHSNISQTMSYIQVSEEEIAKKLSVHKFFTS